MRPGNRSTEVTTDVQIDFMGLVPLISVSGVYTIESDDVVGGFVNAAAASDNVQITVGE